MKKFKPWVQTVFFAAVLLTVFSGCSTKIQNRKAMLFYQDGIKLSYKGDFDGALEKFNRSIAISEENGFVLGVANNYNEIGNVYTYKKQFDIARVYYNQALEIYRGQDTATGVSKTLDNITKSYVRQGDFKQAVEKYEELAAWDTESGNLLGAGIARFNTALIYERYLSDYLKARDLYEQSEEIFIQLGRKKLAEGARKGIERMTF